MASSARPRLRVSDGSLTNEVVLAVTAVVLLCGSAGLLVVSLSSPLLRGLMWVSGSFALGGVSALLQCAHGWLSPVLSASVADVFMLGCFVWLELGVRAVHHEGTHVSRFSLCFLMAQTLLCAFSSNAPELPEARAVSVALLSAQACLSGWMLVRRKGEAARAPVLLCGFLLFLYALLLVGRYSVLESGVITVRGNLEGIRAGTSMAMLAILLGIAFQFFWMTTTVFAHGLERIASTDPLTRIFNRRTFLLWCEKELHRSLDSGMPFSLLIVDLDHFKKVNDMFGHHVGDRLLCTVVERLQDGVRGIDVLGRWGGEEFAVLLPRASAEAAFLVAERVRRNVERVPMELTEAEAMGGPARLQVTASVGTGTFCGPGDSIATLFERADAALYMAKRRGRNCTAISPTPDWLRPPGPAEVGALPEELHQEAAPRSSPELVM